jgi:hypothetical protein
MQFVEWLQHIAGEFPLHYILWTDEGRFTRGGVFNVHNNHLWAGNNPHAIREYGNETRFGVSVCDEISGHTVVGPYLLPDWMTTQR